MSMDTDRPQPRRWLLWVVGATAGLLALAGVLMWAARPGRAEAAFSRIEADMTKDEVSELFGSAPNYYGRWPSNEFFATAKWICQDGTVIVILDDRDTTIMSHFEPPE